MDFAVSSILLYSLVGAVVLVYVPFGLVGLARMQVGYDISAPRAMFDKLPPYAQRATWAHQNSFEALIIYAIAALMAYVTGVTSPWASGAALVFLGARFFYSVFYIANIPLARSLMFATGSTCSGILFVLSLLTLI
ncbi:MAG: MAPEG family protein [Cyanobacteriota bacterium]|nr:MAPEG family protein [Cyanobacteriota bacterium]